MPDGCSPGQCFLPPHLQESPAVGCTDCFSQKRKQLVRTEMLCFGQAVWENVSPLNFMTGSNSFGGRTNVGLFLNTCCVIVTNNRKLIARYVVGQKAVPLGQAADCPHHGCILRAGCVAETAKSTGHPSKDQQQIQGKREGTIQSRSLAVHPIQWALSPIAVGQPKPKAFVWVCCLFLGHQRHFQNEVCHLPCLGDRQRDSPFPYWMRGCHVPATGRKAASGQCKTFLFEKHS